MMRSRAVVAATCLLAVSACSFKPLNSRVLPGAVGTGGSGFPITVEFDSAANLVPNSAVKVDDITVGTVEAITLKDWHAEAKISLRKNVRLPANAVASIGQKSLLGAEYVSLTPPVGEAPSGQLTAGALIPLSQTGRSPETEEVLGALSLLLNGGGIANIGTIVTEANKALHGNESSARALLSNLNTLISTVDHQRDQLLSTIRSVDALATGVNAQGTRIGTAINQIAPGLTLLNAQKGQLEDALAALNRLGTAGTTLLSSSGAAVRQTLHDLQPTLAKLVEAGNALPLATDIAATFIFPVKIVPDVVRGDFLNVATTVDLSLPALAAGLIPGVLPGTPFAKAAPTLHNALEAGDPLTGPLQRAGALITPPVCATLSRLLGVC